MLSQWQQNILIWLVLPTVTSIVSNEHSGESRKHSSASKTPTAMIGLLQIWEKEQNLQLKEFPKFEYLNKIEELPVYSRMILKLNSFKIVSLTDKLIRHLKPSQGVRIYLMNIKRTPLLRILHILSFKLMYTFFNMYLYCLQCIIFNYSLEEGLDAIDGDPIVPHV